MIQKTLEKKESQNPTISSITFDLRIYDKTSIYSACYGVLDIAYISLELLNSNAPYILTVTITPKFSIYNHAIIANTIKEQALCIMFIRNRKTKEYGTSTILLKRFVHWMDGWDEENKN